MNDEQVLKVCENVIIDYLNQEISARNIAEIFKIQSDTTHKRLKEHLKGMITLLEQGIEIIEMNDEQVLKVCENVIIDYLNQEISARNIAEIFKIQSDTTHKRLKEHLKGMITLLEQGIEIIERDNKQ